MAHAVVENNEPNKTGPPAMHKIHTALTSNQSHICFE